MANVLYFHPDAYTTGTKIMGRQAAGESFLRAYLAYAKAQEWWIYTETSEDISAFAAIARKSACNQTIRAIDKSSLASLALAGLLYRPDPVLAPLAWQRTACGHGSWSLCGITHTTAETTCMEAIAAWLTAPLQPWDAIICTSQAVKSNVQSVLEAQAHYLKERLGATRSVLPQLPVIPIGIHASDYAFTAEQRHAARQHLAVESDTIVVLFVGRLSFHAKAHPLAMYQALQQAAQQNPQKKIVLIECGWHASGHIADAFSEAAQQFCPGIEVRTLDGQDAQKRQWAWAGADLFCSLSDNIQETFGITPLEAMATGLPVVVSDWNGYKDTVRDGIDGFRIPTLSPPPGLGSDLALRYALEIDNYDYYCGFTSALVAVDIPAACAAFSQLIAKPALRQTMGHAARQRALEYDWSAIIPYYLELWEQLRITRQEQAVYTTPLPHPWPTHLDPFHAFATYPTRPLMPQTLLALAQNNSNATIMQLRQYLKLSMVNMALPILPQEEELITVIRAARGICCASELIENIPVHRQPIVFRSLSWLVKLGIFKRMDA